MTELEIVPYTEADARRRYAADRPIEFEEWLDFSYSMEAVCERMDTELIRGVMVDKMSAQFPHEWIFAWLHSILRQFASNRGLGIVLGSRSAVQITSVDGRIPDIVFVRAENSHIIQNRAIYGVPDLVIEIVSANDYPYLLIPLESDYRTLGIPEIVFLDPKKKRVRCVRKTENGYQETVLTTGALTFDSIPGFEIEIEWIFADKKPDEFTITKNLIEKAETGA